VDHVEGDGKKDHRQAPAKELTTIESVDRYANHVDDKPGMSTCSVLYSALLAPALLTNGTAGLLTNLVSICCQDSIDRKSLFLLRSNKSCLSTKYSAIVFQKCKLVNPLVIRI
jgi:hypothetical protein